MTARAIIGLVVLNGALLVAGLGLLLAAKGRSSVSELARLAGLAYMVGLAAVGTLLVLGLVVGVPFGAATVLLTAGGLAAAGFAAHLLRRDVSAPEPRGPISPLVTAAGVAVAIVFFEALFRSGRLAQMTGWDPMGFWIPKAKAIYFFGGLDEQLFRELPNASYPPLVPALQAAAFELMGSADVVTLHLAFWFPFVGFVAAVAGLLAPRVRAIFLWPPLLLVVLTPELVDRGLLPMADLVLDFFVALGALLIALWLVERAQWQLMLAAVFLGAALCTKREGLLLAACIVAAAFVVSWRDRRRAWPPLALTGGFAAAVAVPWQIWFRSHEISGQAPSAGGLGILNHLDRAWPSFELALETLFDYDFWLVVMPVAVAAIVLAFLAGARLLPSYAALLTAFAIAGFTWSTWAWLEFPITQDPAVNPIGRVTGGLVVAFAGLLPLLLDSAWHGRDRRHVGA